MPLPPDLEAVVQRNRTRLSGVRDDLRAEILDLGLRAQADLADRLRAIAPDRFSAQETRGVLAQVNAIVDEVGADLGEDVGAASQRAGFSSATIARQDLEAQLATYAPDHPTAARALVDIETLGDVLDDGLLEYYDTSVQRYGLPRINHMRTEIALSVLEGETLSRTIERITSAAGIADWQAERIARTETSLAFHRGWLRDAEDSLGDDADEWRKELVATFDLRTEQDSIFVHGQRRKLGDKFKDNRGREYQHPPNRPNDRETVVLVRVDEPSDADEERREGEERIEAEREAEEG